jgi:hypothetical protein
MGPDTKARIVMAVIFAAAIAASASRAGTTTLAVDAETTANGVPVACTGIGQTRLDPKWQAYDVRVELSNARSEYLVGGAVTVKTAKGAEVVSVSCDAPWILMQLPAGAYRIEGRILNSEAKPRSAPFTPPKVGQMRLVLQFPDA